MENQHRKITGYRELDQTEIDLMNKVKALGAQFEAVLLEVEAHVKAQRAQAKLLDSKLDSSDDEVRLSAEAFIMRLNDATPERFAALAKTDMQTALMYLTRAVAQPTFF